MKFTLKTKCIQIHSINLKETCFLAVNMGLWDKRYPGEMILYLFYIYLYFCSMDATADSKHVALLDNNLNQCEN